MDERDVAGIRLSRAVYMHFTAQEIRELKEVFDFFDHKRRGFSREKKTNYSRQFSFELSLFLRNLKPKEIVYAMKALGVTMSVEQCVAYIEKESRDSSFVESRKKNESTIHRKKTCRFSFSILERWISANFCFS